MTAPPPTAAEETAQTKLRKHAQRLRLALVAIVGEVPASWENANGTDITKALRTLIKVTAYLGARK